MTNNPVFRSTLKAAVIVMGSALILLQSQPASSGPVLRNSAKGAIAGGVVGAIVGDPATGARVGATIGAVKGVKERRDRRRDRVNARRQ